MNEVLLADGCARDAKLSSLPVGQSGRQAAVQLARGPGSLRTPRRTIDSLDSRSRSRLRTPLRLKV